MLQFNAFRFIFFLGIFCFLSIVQVANAQKLPKPPTSKIVRAQIVDKESIPVPGATVLVDGTTKGTVSDVNGFFELDLTQFTEKKVTLIFRFLESEKELEIKINDLPKSYGQIKLSGSIAQNQSMTLTIS